LLNLTLLWKLIARPRFHQSLLKSRSSIFAGYFTLPVLLFKQRLYSAIQLLI